MEVLQQSHNYLEQRKCLKASLVKVQVTFSRIVFIDAYFPAKQRGD